MISPKEIKVLDINTEFFGVKSVTLMENAGKSVAEFILNELKITNEQILILCGPGNNGGDGFVAARYLSGKNKVIVFLTAQERQIKTELSIQNFSKLKKLNIKIYDINSLNKIDELLKTSTLIIDSMLGIGISGELREPYINLVEKINELNDKTIISVDVPTGIYTKKHIIPNFTITFHDKKTSMHQSNSGNIIISDIGIPKKAIEFIGSGELSVYYPRPKTHSHKGQNGKVLVIGGGPYCGAPALSGLAAMRTGCDLVNIASPKSVSGIISSFSPNLIVKELKGKFLSYDHLPVIEKLIKISDSIIIGPGIGNRKETEKTVITLVKFITENKKPLVIDADAIKPIGENLRIIKNTNTVITPHIGEFKDLTGVSLNANINDRIKKTSKWTKKIGVGLLLKGHIDVISNGQEVKLNDIHSVAMTVGGTGDVLAGVIGSLLSRGVDTFNAMRIAAFINGMAGVEAFKNKSYGMIATDLIEEIPKILTKYL